MRLQMLEDELWALIEPLLPKPPRPKRKDRPGRPRVADRKALEGIIYVLRTGIAWNLFPGRRIGFTSASTCRRRLALWQSTGVWAKVHKLLLQKLQGAGRLDWSRAVADSSSVRAVGGGEKNRPQPRGPKKARLEAPYPGRREGNSSGLEPDLGLTPRRDATARSAR